MSKLIVYIDMDGVLCDFEGASKNALARCPEIQYPQSQYGFFTNLKPIKDGLETVRMMLNSEDIDVYILTAPSEYNPLSYTEKRIWVEQHLGLRMVSRLIISPNKSLLKGDILIDDSDSGHGQESFEGTLIQFGSKEAPNWESVNRILALKRFSFDNR